MLYDDKRAYLRLQKCASTYLRDALQAHGLCEQFTGITEPSGSLRK